MKQLIVRCSLCGHKHRPDSPAMDCASCGGPLEFEDAQTGSIREAQGLQQSLFERYRDFLPFDYPDANNSLGEGLTPLIESPFLAQAIGIFQLYLKNETANPTRSFVDRGTAGCIQHALELGYMRVGAVCPDNMGTSVAAYGARSRLETFILAEDIHAEILAPLAAYGPHLIRVACGRDDLLRRSLDIGARRDIYFMNPDAPMRIEGYKTIAYEICEQTNFDVPDLVVTTADPGIRCGIAKGFREFFQLGLIQRLPRLAAALPDCPTGLQTRQTGSPDDLTSTVSDASMSAAQNVLAKTGLLVRPESAATYAILRDLKAREEIGPDSRVVCILAAGDLKTQRPHVAHPAGSACLCAEELEDHIAGIIRQSYMYELEPY